MRKKPSPGRGWQGAALTGVGRYKIRPGPAPHPPPAGGTFPQGKVSFLKETVHTMRILFDSKQEIFKTPFGVLAPGEKCTLHVHIPAAVQTRAAQIVLCGQDG